MYKPMTIPQAYDEPPMEWGLTRIDGGICLSDLEFKLLDNQSPDMLNLWYKDKVLTKRYGQEYLPNNLGEEKIIQCTLYKDDIIYHSDGKLIKRSDGNEDELIAGLANDKGTFFTFNDVLYYVNGKLIEYDGTTAKEVEPFIPVVIINRTPAGGGDTYQN
ncbi:MAG: hypothetical protein M0P77_10295, partial [Firmicutes bacterium]|nr:hypothetical protein [Bacillota bacterium]